MTELLAPAKDKNTAIIAINSGCDALYIGAQSFGARKNASNSLEDIKEIVEYAHKFNVKVHVTINTILSDSELEDAQKLITALYEIGADAIIVQDMGILQLLIEKKIPPIPIHASTQCDNRTLEKIKFFNDIGISRVILARETSIEQIKNICKNINCEIETFIHGALCVSYSGQCYMSCANGGRSANKGECAQSCRKKYTLIDEDGNIIAKGKHLLSLKDFNGSKHLKALVDAGVTSFKIEGRLKDENYVKNVVAFYRQELDKISKKSSSGKIFPDFKPNIEKSFNRGFTDYFLEKRTKCFNFDTPKSIGEKIGIIKETGKDWFIIDKIDSEHKLHSQDGLCYLVNGELEGCLVNKTEGTKIYPNKMNKIKKGTVVYKNYDYEFEKQLSKSKIKRQIGARFVYNEGILHIIDEDNNECAMEILFSEKTKNPEQMKKTFEAQLKKSGDSDFYITEVQINDDLPFIPVSEINNLRRELFEQLTEERLNNYEREYQQPLKYSQFPKKELDYRANVHNNKAKEFYKKCGAKINQMSFESTKPKHVELMRTKHCLKFAFDMCKYPKKLFLIDEKGKKYALKFDCPNCEMAIIDL